MDLFANVCVRCGEPRNNGDAFCPVCAAPTPRGEAECARCGESLRPMVTVEQKSRKAAGWMAIFIGVFGFHNFYLGFIGKATAQLLMTCFSLGLLLPVTWIWSLIEGIKIFRGKADRDAFGNPLRD